MLRFYHKKCKEIQAEADSVEDAARRVGALGGEGECISSLSPTEQVTLASTPLASSQAGSCTHLFDPTGLRIDRSYLQQAVPHHTVGSTPQ